MTATTSYGTWNNRVAPYSPSPESDIADFMNGGGSDWCARMDAAGAVKAIANEYRAAINAALPDSVSLCGEEFIGPYSRTGAVRFDGYPTDEDGRLDFKAIVESIDLGAIVDKHDVDAQPTA